MNEKICNVTKMKCCNCQPCCDHSVEEPKNTVRDLLDYARSRVCDELCKWPEACETQEELNKKCDACPLELI